MTQNEHGAFRWWFAYLPAAALLAMTFGVPLAYETLYAGDMDQNLAWAHRLADENAFPGSRVADYEIWRYGLPGLRVLYWPLVRLMQPLLAGKLLALALGIVVFWLAARIGRVLWPDRPAAGPLAVLGMACMIRPASLNFWAGMEGGLARAFAAPLVLLLCLGALSRRPWMVGLATVVAPLIYPPIFLVLFVAAVGLAAFDPGLRRRLVPGLILGATVALWMFHHLQQNAYGPAPTLEAAQFIPAFRNQEALPLAKATVWENLWALRFGLSLPVIIAVPLWFASSGETLRSVRRLALVLFCAAELCFVAAYVWFFRLYFPDRYLSPVVLLVWLLGTATLGEIVDRFEVSPGALRRAMAVFSLALATAFGANLMRVLPRGEASSGHTGLYRSPLSPRIRQAIAALPGSTLIGGNPLVVSDVPLLCKRGVFLNSDAMFPYNLLYYGRAMRDMREEMQALYSPDYDVVRRFGARNSVDVLLIDRDSYRASVGPTNAWVRSYPELAVPTGADFAVLHPPPASILADDGRFLLVKLSQ